jgi:hypothetical protein
VPVAICKSSAIIEKEKAKIKHKPAYGCACYLVSTEGTRNTMEF